MREFAARPAESFPALSPQAELMAEVAEMKAPEKGAGLSIGGRVVYVWRDDSGKELGRSVYKERAQAICRNISRAGREVHLYQAPIHGHVSAALSRPVGERH